MATFEENRHTAVKSANEKLWQDNPELQRRQLTSAPEDAEYRKQWMAAYRKALVQLEKADGQDPDVDAPRGPRNIEAACGEDVCDKSRTKLCIGYTYAVHPRLKEYHAFVIAEDPCSDTKFITRAGPSAKGPRASSSASASSSAGGSSSASSGNGSSGGFGFGTIRAQFGKWSEALAFDRPSDTVHTQYVTTVELSYEDVTKRMREFAKLTNENKIPYWPLGPNSNSYAFTFFVSMGLARPEPALSVPGYDMGKPDEGLSYYP